MDPFDRPGSPMPWQRVLGDDRLRRSVAEAGKARVASFAWPAVAERYRQVYASVSVPPGGADADTTAARRSEHRAHQGEPVR